MEKPVFPVRDGLESEGPHYPPLGRIDKDTSSCYPTLTMSEERRRISRFRVYHPVRFSLSHSQRVVETLTKDLSTRGLCCLSPTLFPPSTELRLELLLPENQWPIHAHGRVVWFRTIPHSEQFDLGIEFTTLQDQDKIRLSAYLKK